MHLSCRTHSKSVAGTRQRRRAAAARNACFSVGVSLRASIKRVPILTSLAHDGRSPQRQLLSTVG
ncbi:MAG: hypothetical protein QOC75_5172, partial [Pseudonocardiales bacterium]|nr:hypothetical protein [Pseudonocardiales bacterium]